MRRPDQCRRVASEGVVDEMAMFGDLVRMHRRRRGLTQEELADLVGLNVRTVGKIEANKIAAPRPVTVGLLADAFGLAGAERERFCDAASDLRLMPGPVEEAEDGQPEEVGRPAPAQLPADVSGFVGRTEQLDTLTALLDRAAGAGRGDTGEDLGGAVVITAIGGTAGVGKTALAVRWGHRVRSRFPDGQLYVNLRGYDPDAPVSPEDALTGFLRALGLTSSEIPPTVDERAAAFRTLLAGRRMLLVLDNASSEEQVRPLLPGSPTCVSVVTSRDSLAGLVARDGAVRVTVDVLSLPDAVALLRAMIGRRVDEDAACAAALAEQCARLPLALRIAAEVAASRPTVPLADLVAELGDEGRRLAVLDAGQDDRTRVGVVFSWSYLSLSTDAARLFRLLGLHPAPDITAYAAAALADMSLDYAGVLLDVLARAHLVQRTAPGRYAVHDLLRAYAGDVARRVESEVERRAAVTRLFDHYLATAAEATETLHPGERQRRPVVAPAATPAPPVAKRDDALAWLDAELSTLTRIARYAATNGWEAHTIQLSAVLYRHLNVNGQSEGRTIHTAARDAARRIGDRAAEAAALVRIGIEFARHGNPAEAERVLLVGVDVARVADDRVSEGMALGALAVMCWHLGRYEQTATVLAQALAVHRQTGDVIGESVVRQNLGVLHCLQGRWAESRQHLTAALARADEIGFRDTEVNILCSLSDVHVREGRYDEAAACLDRAMSTALVMKDHVGEMSVLRDIGQLRLHQGRLDEAVDPLLKAIAAFQPLGINDGAGIALSRLGEVRRRQGAVDEAVELLEQAMAVIQTAGDVAERCVTLTRLGRTRHDMGQLDVAVELLTEAVTMATEAGLRYDEAVARAALAELRRTRREREAALEEARRALALFTELGVPETEDQKVRVAELEVRPAAVVGG